MICCHLPALMLTLIQFISRSPICCALSLLPSLVVISLLCHQYSTEGKIKEPNLASEAGQSLMSAATSYARGDMGSVFSSVTGFIRTASNLHRSEAISKTTKTSPADCVREPLATLHHAHLQRRFLGVVARIRRPARTRKKPEEPQAL
jgi:hypothetical protein